VTARAVQAVISELAKLSCIALFFGACWFVFVVVMSFGV
jgi:hypothetical protein